MEEKEPSSCDTEVEEPADVVGMSSTVPVGRRRCQSTAKCREEAPKCHSRDSSSSSWKTSCQTTAKCREEAPQVSQPRLVQFHLEDVDARLQHQQKVAINLRRALRFYVIRDITFVPTSMSLGRYKK